MATIPDMSAQNNAVPDPAITQPPPQPSPGALPDQTESGAPANLPAPQQPTQTEVLPTAGQDPSALAATDPVPPNDLKADEMGPSAALAGDDATQDYHDRHSAADRVSAVDALDKLYPPKQKALASQENAPVEGAPGVSKPSQPAAITSVALDMMIGGMEVPHAVAYGARNAVQATINLATELSVAGKMYQAWAGKNTSPQLPEVDAPKTVTGGLVAGATQFLTGALMTGGPIGAATKGMALPAAIDTIVKGGAAGFVAFNAHDGNLANFIQDHFPVTKPLMKYMAGDPEDSELYGRAKNALVGELPAAALKALMTAVKTIKYGRIVEAGQRAIKLMDGEEIPGREIHPTELTNLGNIEHDGLFLPKEEVVGAEKMGEALDKTSALSPSDVTKKSAFSAENVNWARIDDEQSVKTVIQNMASNYSADLESARGGSQTYGQIAKSAQQEDALKLLLSRRQGEAYNPAQTKAVGDFYVSASNKLMELGTIAGKAPTDANIFAFRKMAAIHYMVQKEIVGSASQAGKNLNAQKMIIRNVREMNQQIQDVIKNSGGVEANQQLAMRMAKLGAAGLNAGVDTMVRQSLYTRLQNVVSQVWMFGLLSGPKSLVANTLSNFGYMNYNILVRKNAEYVSQLLGKTDGVQVGEATAMMHAQLTGYNEALRALGQHIGQPGTVKDAAKNTLSFFREAGTNGKFTDNKLPALAPETWDVARNTNLGRALDIADIATRANSRLMSATDDVFKMTASRQELQAIAHRQVMQEALDAGQDLTHEEYRARLADKAANATDEMLDQSNKYAAQVTFTKDPAPVLNGIASAWQKLPVIGRLSLPFRSTPINIFTEFAENSPMAPFVASWRADFLAGGARQDLAIAKMATGSIFLSVFTDLALSGRITGNGPSHPAQRDQWMREGNQPNSFRIGDKFYSFDRTDPIGMTASAGANYADAAVNAQDDLNDKDFQRIMATTIFGIGHSTLKKSYMQGMLEFIGAINDPEQGKRYLQKVAGSAVPTLASEINKNGLVPGASPSEPATAETPYLQRLAQGDPYMRVVDGAWEAFLNRVPGMSATLPLARDLWGRTIDYRSGLGYLNDMFNPIHLKTANPEPVDKELKRLGYFPGMPNRQMTFNDLYDASPIQGGVPLRLNTAQYDKFVKLAGNEWEHPATGMGCKDFLNAVVKGDHPLSAEYNNPLATDGPDGTRATFIKNWITQYRDGAKVHLLENDGSVKVDYQMRKAAKANELTFRSQQ